jgi:hypothetical protein
VAPLDEVLAPDYLDGLSDWPIERVRARRDEAAMVETGLLYLRRIAQGRLDIVRFEQGRRRRGEPGPDLSELVGRLPEILADRVDTPGEGLLTAVIAPGEVDPRLSAQLEAALPSARLDAIFDFNAADLAAVSDALGAFEQSVAAQRHAVLDVIDRLQEELVRRYRSGEATVDSLLP